MAALERGDQGRVFNQLTARAVDDAHALLHLGEGAFVDDTGGLGREAHVEREVIRAGDELVDCDETDSVFAGHGGGDKRVAADDLKAESAGTAGHFKPDAAEAENAECLAAQLSALEVLLVPLACVH